MKHPNEQHPTPLQQSPTLDEHAPKATPSGKRRLLITSLIGGSAVAPALSSMDNWTKPVVQSLLLPAHAQSSPTTVGKYSVTYRYGGAITATTVAPDPHAYLPMTFMVEAEEDISSRGIVAEHSDEGGYTLARNNRQWRVTFADEQSWFKLSLVPVEVELRTGGEGIREITTPFASNKSPLNQYTVGIEPPVCALMPGGTCAP